MARITRRSKPSRSARGKSPASASIARAMTKRLGVQPGTGIGGSPHGTSAGTAGGRGSTSGDASAKGKRKGNMLANRAKRGYNI